MTVRSRVLVRLLACLAAAMAVTPAGAADLFWFGDGTNIGGTGNWSAAGTNWSGSAMGPAGSTWNPASTAVFQSPSGTATITDMSLAANAGLRFTTAGYTVTGNTLSLGGAFPTSNALNVVTAGDTATINSIVAGSNGLAKTGAGTAVLGAANSYTGETWIEGGTLTVAGMGASIATGANLFAGYNTTGNFRVSGGASASCSNAYLGNLATSTGNDTTVTGGSSQLVVAGDLAIGHNGGTNTFAVSSGGAVTMTNGFLGYFPTSDGNQATVGGVSSTWNHSNVLEIGHQGSMNTFTVNADGYATSGKDTVVGALAGAEDNLLKVSGANAKYEVTTGFTLVVGDFGANNAVEVDAGGLLMGHSVRLGRQVGSDGNSVTVSGTGSKWTNTNTLRVGNLGSTNTVLVSAGAEVTFTGTQYIGHGVGTDANAVTITGTNTQWTGGNMVVGLDGTNSVLSVCDNATFTSPGVAVAQNPGSSGTVKIGCGAAPGTFNSPIQFGDGTGALVFNHTSPSYTFANAIVGPGSVSHVGGGTTTLTGPSGYTGGTTITAGTVRLGSGSALPSGGAVVLNGGTLDANGQSASLGNLTVNANSMIDFGTGGAQSLVFASATYNGGLLIVKNFEVGEDQLILTADPAATGILDHIQFAGYPLGARWEPGSGEVVPRLAGLAAPAPALSPVGVALGIAVLTALGLLALSRRRYPAA